jgi:hypothetical protein
MVMKHFQHLFRLFVALIAISTARAVYAQQEVLLKIDVIRLDSRFDKLCRQTRLGQRQPAAPNEPGIALFSNSKPISGDITAKIILWDAGTEINEKPRNRSKSSAKTKSPLHWQRRE